MNEIRTMCSTSMRNILENDSRSEKIVKKTLYDKYIFYLVILFMKHMKFMSYIFIPIAQRCLFY